MCRGLQKGLHMVYAVMFVMHTGEIHIPFKISTA